MESSATLAIRVLERLHMPHISSRVDEKAFFQRLPPTVQLDRNVSLVAASHFTTLIPLIDTKWTNETQFWIELIQQTTNVIEHYRKFVPTSIQDDPSVRMTLARCARTKVMDSHSILATTYGSYPAVREDRLACKNVARHTLSNSCPNAFQSIDDKEWWLDLLRIRYKMYGSCPIRSDRDIVEAVVRVAPKDNDFVQSVLCPMDHNTQHQHADLVAEALLFDETIVSDDDITYFMTRHMSNELWRRREVARALMIREFEPPDNILPLYSKDQELLLDLASRGSSTFAECCDEALLEDKHVMRQAVGRNPYFVWQYTFNINGASMLTSS